MGLFGKTIPKTVGITNLLLTIQNYILTRQEEDNGPYLLFSYRELPSSLHMYIIC
jgi:hypothetical protein